MEMEGRGYSDYFRNTSEELFLKTMMESSIGMPVPTMEMLGFKNLTNNFRTDSEELFKSWLTNGENNGYTSASVAHRTRSRLSTELVSLSNQQPGSLLQKKRSNENLFLQNTSVSEEPSTDLDQHSINRNAVDRGLQCSNLYLAKAWFHSSQPMTRSRSSELRRRYVAMQNSQTSLGIEALQNTSGHDVNSLKQEFENTNILNDNSMHEIPNQFNTFMSPTNSSSSTFNTSQMGTGDKVSSVVSLLKGTLERRKLSNRTEKEAVEDSLGCYGAQAVIGSNGLNQEQANFLYEAQGTFQDASTLPLKDSVVLPKVGGSLEFDLEGYVAPNSIQQRTLSREPSQSESSAAAPVVSTGFDACDGPSNSGQTRSIYESSRNQVGSGRNSENGYRAKENGISRNYEMPYNGMFQTDMREQTYDNSKEDHKQKGSLVRYGSVNSAVSVEKGDPTKKRRVERSRKMAEAKERNLTPAIPSDMQSILKRCENLEKEVRSLKLNLAFMNRKDSEQTKQIEELQKQNGELGQEKERLLEEIERIISETSNM